MDKITKLPTKLVVILERGSKGDKIFLAEEPKRAIQRATALCNLHNCYYTQKDNVIYVHAADYYGGAQ